MSSPGSFDRSIDVVLVTCRAWPTLSASDSALAEELRRRGHRVLARPWNEAPVSDFTSAEVVVLD